MEIVKIYQPIPAGYHNIHTVIWKDQNKDITTKVVYNI